MLDPPPKKSQTPSKKKFEEKKSRTPKQNENVGHPQKEILDRKKKRKTSLDPLIKFFSLHGNGDTIGIGREIQCLLQAGFFTSGHYSFFLEINLYYIAGLG